MHLEAREVDIEAGDDVLALNTLSAANLHPRSPWFHRVDANDAGAFGHSFGGAVCGGSLLSRSKGKGSPERRWIDVGEVATRGLDKPYMVMNDDSPAITPAPAEFQGRETRRRESKLTDNRYFEYLNHTMGAFGGYELTILGTRHFNFTDRPLYSPLRRLTDSGTYFATASP